MFKYVRAKKYARAHEIIDYGNKTEWSPIRFVIIRVITKSDRRAHL